MPTDQKVARLAGLLDAVRSQHSSFLQKCTDAKLLALSDMHQAIKKYQILTETMLNSEALKQYNNISKNAMYVIKEATQRGTVNENCVRVLESLRIRYIEDILRPAVRDYLNSGSQSLKNVRQMYETAIKLQGLLRVAQFLCQIEETQRSS